MLNVSQNKLYPDKTNTNKDYIFCITFSLCHMKRDDWQEEWGETDKTMAEEFQNEM